MKPTLQEDYSSFAFVQHFLDTEMIFHLSFWWRLLVQFEVLLAVQNLQFFKIKIKFLLDKRLFAESSYMTEEKVNHPCGINVHARNGISQRWKRGTWCSKCHIECWQNREILMILIQVAHIRRFLNRSANCKTIFRLTRSPMSCDKKICKYLQGRTE